MTYAKRKPWLLLDVDGVICTLGAGCREPQRELRLGWQYVRIPEGVPVRLALLMKSFRFAWATGWGHEANELLAEPLGLPALPVLDFPDEDDTPGIDYKLPAIRRFVRDAPFAWVDDDIGPAAHAWIATREPPSLLLQTHPGRGLTDDDVRELLDWATTATS